MRVSKYNAVKVKQDGYTFDSKKEARRYVELKALQGAKLISDLKVHPRYDLVVPKSDGNSKKVGTYEADFYYWDNEKKKFVVEDVKGVRTQLYVLKKNLMNALYNIEVDEV